MVAKSMDIASQIRAARTRLDLTQQEAATAWGVNLRTLQGWEARRSVPRGPTLNRLLPILFPAVAPSARGRPTGSRS